MNQKGIIGTIIFAIIAIIVLFLLGYYFVAKPHKIVGNLVTAPFESGQYVLSEKITYLFRKPAVGDRVIFTPQNIDNDFVGIITKTEDQENVTSHTIVSVANGKPWLVSTDKISRKIYVPYLSQPELEKIISSLKPVPSTQPITQPSPVPDETTNWKTYVNTKYKYLFKYPASYEATDANLTLQDLNGEESSVEFLKYRYAAFGVQQDKNTARERAHYDYVGVVVQNGMCPTLKTQSSTILVDHINAKKYIGSSSTFADPQYGDILVLIEKNSICYHIAYLRNPIAFVASEKIFNQMMSTFKFTE